MSTGARASFADDLVAFTARLDGLHTDQDLDNLSDALRTALEERELNDMCISCLINDTERARVLLEAFNKVRSATMVSRE